jgi:hypothetical protein
MKRLIAKTLAVAFVASAGVWAGTAPNISDAVLVSYKLSADQAADFAAKATSTVETPFWTQWDQQNANGLTRDYIKMDGGNAAYIYTGDAGKFSGAADATLEIRCAYDDNGVYFDFKVTDNLFLPPDATGWVNDAVDMYFDPGNLDPASAGYVLNTANWINPAQFSLTVTCKQVQVCFGDAAIAPTTFQYSTFDPTAPTGLTPQTIPFNRTDIKTKLVAISSTQKSQEWFIPWLEWTGGTAAPAIGTRLAYEGGYNDNDGSDQTTLKRLRWHNNNDLWGLVATDVSTTTWGEIEIGDVLGGTAVLRPLANLKGAKALGKTDFYNVRGERVNATGVKASNLIVRCAEKASPTMMNFVK